MRGVSAGKAAGRDCQRRGRHLPRARPVFDAAVAGDGAAGGGGDEPDGRGARRRRPRGLPRAFPGAGRAGAARVRRPERRGGSAGPRGAGRGAGRARAPLAGFGHGAGRGAHSGALRMHRPALRSGRCGGDERRPSAHRRGRRGFDPPHLGVSHFSGRHGARVFSDVRAAGRPVEPGVPAGAGGRGRAAGDGACAHGRGGLAARDDGGRRLGGGRLRAVVPADHFDAVFPAVPAGGQRLYGAHGVCG